MKKILKILAITALVSLSGGCCICCRSWKIDKEITGHCLPASGTYHYYTNGLQKAYTYRDYQTGEMKEGLTTDCVYKYCSNANGPWAGSEIYPATRFVLNGLSLFSYSSAASGDYMMGGFVLVTYPFWLVELPVQFVLDTVLLPWDLIAAPTTPDGYKKVF